MHDPFHARDTFDTGAGRVGIYRLSRVGRRRPDADRRAALFDPRAAGVRAAELRRLRR